MVKNFFVNGIDVSCAAAGMNGCIWGVNRKNPSGAEKNRKKDA